jgi:hypothetical protein
MSVKLLLADPSSKSICGLSIKGPTRSGIAAFPGFATAEVLAASCNTPYASRGPTQDPSVSSGPLV